MKGSSSADKKRTGKGWPMVRALKGGGDLSHYRDLADFISLVAGARAAAHAYTRVDD